MKPNNIYFLDCSRMIPPEMKGFLIISIPVIHVSPVWKLWGTKPLNLNCIICSELEKVSKMYLYISEVWVPLLEMSPNACVRVCTWARRAWMWGNESVWEVGGGWWGQTTDLLVRMTKQNKFSQWRYRNTIPGFTSSIPVYHCVAVSEGRGESTLFSREPATSTLPTHCSSGTYKGEMGQW